MTKDTLIGKHLDEYRLDKLLGQGGMARVYLAEDVRLKRKAAVKVIDPPFRTNSEYMMRFEREAQAVAQLEHPHIVRVYRYGDVDGLLYMAMQYIDGPDLRAVLAAYRQTSERIDSGEASRVIRDICMALDYAHQRGVIHRDIKPSNVLLDKQGQVFLADFGLARLRGIGTQGKIFGSPHYMAPEQAISSASVVPQSDLYAVGVILYQMFTGQLPFDAENPTDIAMQHMTELPRPLRELCPDLSVALERVVLKALAKEPDKRYASGADLAAAVEQALQVTRPGASARYPTMIAHPGIVLRGGEGAANVPPLPPVPAAVAAPGTEQTAKPRNKQPAAAPAKKTRRRWPVYLLSVFLLVIAALSAVLAFPVDGDNKKTIDAADVDGDGVADAQDRCLAEAGLAVVDGCPLTAYVLVTQANMNVILRAEPGTDAEVLGWLRDNQPVTVLGRDETSDWLRVRALNNADGQEVAGWVAEALITMEVAVNRLPVVGGEGMP